jgi:hypothetical protein
MDESWYATFTKTPRSGSVPMCVPKEIGAHENPGSGSAVAVTYVVAVLLGLPVRSLQKMSASAWSQPLPPAQLQEPLQ